MGRVIGSSLVALLLVLLCIPAPGDEEPAPIRFIDISAVSGGPVDFGTPISDKEKATGAFVDVDGDGWDDLITLTGAGQPTGFFLNRPDGAGGRTFVPAPAGHGLDSGPMRNRDGGAITAGDVDGDGDEDLYVGMMFGPGLDEGDNLLLLNDGTGRFTDVTAEVGLTDGDNSTAACAFFDMDLDGDLDLITANTAFPATSKEGDGVTHLFRNMLSETGELYFVDETSERGIVEEGAAVWALICPDYDNDGDADILITHDGKGGNQLFRNDGTGHFTDVTDTASTDGKLRPLAPYAMGAEAADYDNDDDLDIYVTMIFRNPLYVNEGDGTFDERVDDVGISAGMVTWGCLFADFDLDGWLDLHVAGGDTFNHARESVRSFVYRNLGDGTFEDVSETAGLRHDVPLHREMGTALSDFDLDGRPDILSVRAERAGASPYLYRNVTATAGRRFLLVRAIGNGKTSNTSAIGAQIRVIPRDAEGNAIESLRSLRWVAGAISRGARSSLVQCFGLGSDAASADVEVVWPRAGDLASRTELFTGLPVDRRIEIREDEGALAFLSSEASAEIPGGLVTDLHLVPATVAIEEAPGWVSLVGDPGEQLLRCRPENVQTEEPFTVVLTARHVGSPLSDSRQNLTIRVVPQPRIISVKRKGRRLVIRGENLPAEGPIVLVDGIPCPRVKVTKKRLEADGDATRLVAKIPREIRRGFKRAAHIVLVERETGGIATLPFPHLAE